MIPVRDYPRAGGEDIRRTVRQPGTLGLPPRRRGRLLDTQPSVISDGTTPAQAGKTTQRTGRLASPRDYPRAGGEDLWRRYVVWRLSGLPPRRRGRHSWAASRIKSRGTTPAQAGKTACRPASRAVRWDYPRAGGEDVTRERDEAVEAGLPPRRRGRPAFRPKPRPHRGTTPAQAGKTPSTAQPEQ